MSRIRANKITNKIGTGAIELEKGAHLPIGMGITGAGGLNITGVVTATSFSGSGAALTGIDATALKDPAGNVKIQAQASGAVHTGIHTFTTLNVTTVTPTIVNATQINATAGAFTGNVSIGGTLTYEDVTNIDSVGLITARTGIKVTGGELIVGNSIKLGNAGVITATQFVGDGSQLSGISGGGGGGVTVQDEGSSLSTTGTTLNFVGAGVVATGTGATKTITISGGGGGSSTPADDDIQVGDVLLFQSTTGNLDHVAVYIGDNMILNHNIRRLSCREPFDLGYQQALRGVYRYAA